MYISKNLNDKGRVKSYTINDVSWNDLRRLLVSSDALREAAAWPAGPQACPTRWLGGERDGVDALKEASIELKLDDKKP